MFCPKGYSNATIEFPSCVKDFWILIMPLLVKIWFETIPSQYFWFELGFILFWLQILNALFWDGSKDTFQSEKDLTRIRISAWWNHTNKCTHTHTHIFLLDIQITVVKILSIFIPNTTFAYILPFLEILCCCFLGKFMKSFTDNECYIWSLIEINWWVINLHKSKEKKYF